MTDANTNHMKRCIKLALKGRGRVSPNPRVGAVVISRSGDVIGEGYHDHFGGAHAEIDALSKCQRKDLNGATIVVNLEPCCYTSKTPPCTDAIIASGVSRVVAAVRDPNPRVDGGGFDALRSAGIDIVEGVMKNEAVFLNRGYFSSYLYGRAWCTVKVALSLDGKMANPEGKSKWITGREARHFAHALRADHDGVLVGGGTMRSDDPELTVRMVKAPNAARIVLSQRYGIPALSKIARTADKARTLLLLSEGIIPELTQAPSVEILRLPSEDDGSIDPGTILLALPKRGIQSVLIEGGAKVLSAFMQSGLIDEIWVGVAPSVIGAGISPFEYFTPASWESRPKFVVEKVRRLGSDVVIKFSRERGLFSQV